jgi:hypothetical protein
MSVCIAALAAELWLRYAVPAEIYMWVRNIIQQEVSEPYAPTSYRNRPGASIRFRNREFDTQVTINAQGLRDDAIDYVRTPGRYRIAVLGDSFVFGWGVNHAQTLSEVLEQTYLRDVDVLNMGVSGFNTYQATAFFQTEGVKYAPDLVLLFWAADGVESFPYDVYFEQGRMYLASLDGQPLDVRNRLVRRLMRTSHLLCWLQRRRWDMKRWVGDRLLRRHRGMQAADVITVEDERAAEVAAEAQYAERCVALFQQLKATLQQAGGTTLCVVYQPDKDDYTAQSLLQTLGRAADVPVIDLAQLFQMLPSEQRDQLYFRLDDHWSAIGHRVTARLVAQALIAQDLVPVQYRR